MRKLVSFLLAILLTCTLSAQIVIVGEHMEHPSRKYQMVIHPGFTACYNFDTLQPDWVSWTLTPETVVFDGNVSRSNEFLPDPMVTAGPCATTQSYSRTGYDRGHMAPAADFRYDQTAQDETFYMTNICLQDHTLNEKTWFELEKRCRYWSKIFYKTAVHVAAGPLFTSYGDRVGKDSLPVPAAFWKVVCKCDRGRWECIGFVFSNEPKDDDWRNYAVSVDKVEKLTGLDFFPELEGKMDESSFNLNRWK